MINLFKTAMTPEAVAAASEILQSGFVGQGRAVDDFEAALKDTFRNPYVVTVNSATSGLTLALHMLGLSEGTQVLTTPLTCTATNLAILANNLIPQWVDVDPSNLCFDFDDLSEKLTANTRVLMVVHWGGYPQPLDRIEQIREEYQKNYGHELHVIHDCAHSFGSLYNSEQLANYGKHYFVYSFGPVKTLSCVDGGCIVTPDAASYERAKLLRWYGIDRENRENDILEAGFKYHMNNLNAAIGLANLPAVHHRISQAVENAMIYTEEYFYKDNISGLSIPESEWTVWDSQLLQSSYYLYTVYVERRESFVAVMRTKGIECGLPHRRNDNYACVSRFKTNLPKLDSIYSKIVCIPVGWWLGDYERRYVGQAIKEGW